MEAKIWGRARLFLVDEQRAADVACGKGAVLGRQPCDSRRSAAVGAAGDIEVQAGRPPVVTPRRRHLPRQRRRKHCGNSVESGLHCGCAMQSGLYQTADRVGRPASPSPAPPATSPAHGSSAEGDTNVAYTAPVQRCGHENAETGFSALSSPCSCALPAWPDIQHMRRAGRKQLTRMTIQWRVILHSQASAQHKAHRRRC